MNTKTKTTSKPAAAAPLEIAENQKAAAAAWNVPLAVLKLAKSQGCTAFKSGRVHRGEFLEWLKNNEGEAQGAVALDLQKANKAELEMERIRCQIVLLRSRNDREVKETIPVAEASVETARCISIGMEEAKGFMEKDHFRVFCERWKSRVGEIFELSRDEMVAAIDRVYAPKPPRK